ncbi:MAG TPA: cupin-like domain-containing protein [Longimicrobium sp.]|uniref:cupin-like domain-containing protein n=1 Tax=Longimicrobium sp. TaxID=2029185 RepID=UPI002ED899F5
MITAPEPAVQPRGEVDRVARLSPREFAARYLRPGRPVLLTGMMDEWPAMRRWSFQSLARLNAECQVCLEEGNVIQGETALRHVKLGEFLNALASGAAAAPGRVPYLSLFDIFTVLPQLVNDVDFSLLRRHTVLNRVFAWLGPAGTVSGFHQDWMDNVLAQVLGRKRVLLAAPDQSPMLYPSEKYEYRCTLASVDPDSWDPARHPRFARARLHEVVLHPGEMLFIPRGWWHRVQSLDASISVNNFGHRLRHLLLSQPVWWARDVLHERGMYGRACTCHMIVDGRRVSR